VSHCELIIVIHNHQPVGNFDSVVEDGYQRAYLPFLDLLERREEVRIGLHNSGCLWEWLEDHHPEYGERVAALVRRGQVELLGGGFYEPILPMLPSRDRRGQLRRMTRFLRERFGVEPEGIWLAERVWETHLAADLAAEGIRYLCLDDSQFLQAGLRDVELTGYYLTEDSGQALGLYPIQMRLRYEIPFAEPAQVIETLRRSADDEPGTMRLFGDDGEKFGIWPGTHKLCYEERWLDRFFDAVLGESGWLSLSLPREHRNRNAPKGRVYLPAGSYREMTEWALPPHAQVLFEETASFLRESGRTEAEQLLLRGGFFRNFLTRYAESNQMHKRTLLALDALDRADGLPTELADEIRDHFWRAQCNCAYWHGVFGGLYLPHLRDAVYREILRGERKLNGALRGERSWAEARVEDYDHDGDKEAILCSDRLALFLSPKRGGGLLEWDHVPSERNLVNTLTRRQEAYHRKLQAGPAQEQPGTAETIHARITAKEEHLGQYLQYDRWDRLALIDRFFSDAPAPEALREASDGPLDFTGRPYDLSCDETGGTAGSGGVARVRLSREGSIDGNPDRRVRLEKTIVLEAGDDAFCVQYLLRSTCSEFLHFFFGVEWVVNLLAGRAHDRYVLVRGDRAEPPELAGMAVHPGVPSLTLVDEWSGISVELTAENPTGWLRAPQETVSLSEAGAERVFQGTVVLPYWEITLAPGESRGFRLGAGVRTAAKEVEPARS